MSTCASGKCRGHGPLAERPLTGRRVEFVVRTEDDEKHGPFDSLTAAQAYKDEHGGYVLVRAKTITP